jgi:tRNA(Ile)-lysidine synthase
LSLSGATTIGELGVEFVIGEEGERFDADALGDGLFVRTWENGDRFQPLGMNGEKKLQDFFVDEKVPRRRRGRVPLVCAADGRIAWVVGHRIAEPFKVMEQTRRLVRLGAKSIQG